MTDRVPIPPDPAAPAVPVRPLTAWLADYERHLALERNMSPHTVRMYHSYAAQALGYFAEQLGRPPVPADLTLPHLRSWAAWMHQLGYGYSSLALSRVALKSFGEFLCAHDAQEANHARRLSPLQNPGKRLPSFLTRADVEKLMEAARDEVRRWGDQVSQQRAEVSRPIIRFTRRSFGPGTAPILPRRTYWLAVRNLAILEVLYAAALRITEVCGLDVADVDLEGSQVLVHGKGGRERLGILGRPAVAALRDWLEHRPRLWPADHLLDPALFLSRRGKRILSRNMYQMVRLNGELARLDMKLHPHLLRHAAATHMLEAGCDVRGVQEYLGHQSIDSTAGYLDVSGAHLRGAYDKAHPRAAAVVNAGAVEGGSGS